MTSIYLKTTSKKKINSDDIAERAHMALAWGTPDSESIGMSSGEWIGLVRDMLREIELLRSCQKSIAVQRSK